MVSEKQDNGRYDIPFKKYSSFKLSYHLLYIAIILLFGGAALIPMGNDIEGILFKIFFAVIAILLACLWILTAVSKKQYIELTDDYILYKTPFIRRKIKWSEIYDVQVFTQSYNTMLGIALKEKVKKRKESFWSMINDMYGGMYTVRIVMAQFSEIDIEKLYGTIMDKLIEVNEKQDSGSQNNCDFNEIKADNDEENSNYFLAVFKALFISIIIGIIYGFSIYLLDANYIIIPVFGTIAVIYYYCKSYTEVKINVIKRIIIGIICSLQVFTAMIVAIFMDMDISFTLNNLIGVIREYVSHTIEEPLEQGMMIFIAIICFGFGAFQGHTFKFQRKIKKTFMKQGGKYYYSKEGRLITIYLIDPAEYDEDENGKSLIQINQGCLIERDGKKIKGFYIPKEIIEESQVKLNYDYEIEINNSVYCKIDMGSNGGYKEYMFPCTLIMNSKGEVEIINIEI